VVKSKKEGEGLARLQHEYVIIESCNLNVLRLLVARGWDNVNNKLFVGNLSFKTSQQVLQDLFAEFGEVVSVSIPLDRDTGKPRGFAFVEMSNQASAEAAIKGLNGREVDGRQIAVNVSTPKPKTGGGSRDRW